MSDTTVVPMVNHEEAFADLGALALGALNTNDAAAVQAHVDTCTICSSELQALRAVVSELPSSPPDAELNQISARDLRNRLVERARGASARSTSTSFWQYASIAATIAFVIAASGYFSERSKRSEDERQVASKNAVVHDLTTSLQEKNSQLAAMTGPAVRVMEMSATGVNAPTARMFWDRATNRWTVFAHGLAIPKQGRAYELWLVTADKKIPAGVFKPSGDGSAVFTATYALQPSDLKAIAVTEEPEAGVAAPTGSIILLGSASGT